MKRLVDIVAAILLAVLLLPVMAVVALAIRFELGSPVLFRQVRSGRHGRPFTIVKFRTMRPESRPGEPDSARESRLGRVLRAGSVDEFPQLWNVLRGDMSIVGPRPTLPEQVVHYTDRQRGRLAVRPGLTGWAQVNGRNSLSWPQRIELDLWYVANASAWLDVQIVARTVLRLVRPVGITGPGGVNPGFPAPAARSASLVRTAPDRGADPAEAPGPSAA